jgi:signal transduction histidine kinase
VGFTNRLRGEGNDRSVLLVSLFLMLGVLAPTACVLWFMNEAAKGQADSARQSITEAYRGQMHLISDRIDSFWTARAAALQANSGEGTAAEFARIVSQGLADSAVLFDKSSAVSYPLLPTVRPVDPVPDQPDWRAAQALEARRGRLGDAAAAYARIAKSERDPSLAARAAQGQIRCLVQSGRKEDAVRAIQEQFNSGPASKGLDVYKRLIAADEQLLALQLITPNDRRYPSMERRLATFVGNYESAALPSSQRLFLMHEMSALRPDLPAFPTAYAERFAAQFLEVDQVHAGGTGLQATHVADLWRLSSANGRVTGLYRGTTVMFAMGRLLSEPSGGAVFGIADPNGGQLFFNGGHPEFVPAKASRGPVFHELASPPESISAGALLPGWHITFSLQDKKAFEDAARRRKGAYLWVGFLVIAAMTVMVLIAGHIFRRQLRLARLRTDLAASVSHELRTPIASTQLLVDSLLEDVQLDPVKTRDYLELIAGENQRLTRLIENFLTFSRIQRNRQQFEFSATNPANVIQSAVLAMRERLQPPACDLKIDIGPDLPSLQADEHALVTVLLNLLDNAYKYTPTDRRVSVRAYHEPGHVVFAVEDNGIGIASRDQRRIFRRFYQVDQSLARETGGCGLGLSIVDFIVRAHGGKVRVDSKSGAGSTFSVVLPCNGKSSRANS